MSRGAHRLLREGAGLVESPDELLAEVFGEERPAKEAPPSTALVDGPQNESLRELRGLEVELLPGGTARIGHGRRGHDDYADVIALVAREATKRGPRLEAIGEPTLVPIRGRGDYY